ncbi:hypothetical protein ACFHW2_34865 [Actinomadura sp. LOL_016]|uniref:hypothetical protein n=1 Tax=unclassified Actinomadura TaxID=2626254 RepID=UPI003A805F06
MHDELTALAGRLAAAGERPAAPCPDPVNAPMIRNWTQALGDPGSWDDVAPPAMIQVWSMPGLAEPAERGVADEVLRLLEDTGHTGVVATNCEQTYDRYVKVGEHLRSTMRFGGVAGPKTTAMGEGYFVTWHQSWYDGNGERVAEMLFRVLKFRPRESAGAAAGGEGPPPARAGEPADGLTIDLTPTFVISTAIATRDFTPVHHDTALARAQGSRDIFVNILTTMGLVQRRALDAVPGAELAGIDVRLGAPAYAGDALVLTAERVDDRTLRVRGRVGSADHVTATVRLREPR